ncbi:Holliday junction resolvase RuvX [Salinicoccus sp. ID82-1]|uniref:Putative pre-16S rRNA nuclease n=1 Tax=Salinicoccus cyprini TaxID=2493691 RepID=A0A558AYK4_9STAP|nr:MULTISPECIES: Holliday junction resolvase RuvX [Salinicoccus]MCG1008884.1 Holliday junction resolvase RuvX [Salinicoccus sp. ID82-1]TVT29346.1 Holliday junction resolvase RuvX [Salinicoccus cyprini]
MNRILGLDVGTKTVGVALSDALGWTAQGLTTLKINYDEESYGIEEISQIVRDNNVSRIVVGLPKNMNNTVGESGDRSIHYSKLLEKKLPDVRIILWDERLSTIGAERSLLEADLSRKKRKAVIDKMAAVFILQGYLDNPVKGD